MGYEEVWTRQLGHYLWNCVNGPFAAVLEPAIVKHAAFMCGAESGNDEDDDEPVRISRRRLIRALRPFRDAPESDEPFERNALFLRDEFHLDDEDLEIVRLWGRYQRNGRLEQFADHVLHRLRSVHQAIAALNRLPPAEAHRHIVPLGNLQKSGVMAINLGSGPDLAGPCGALQVPPPLKRTLFRPYDSRGEFFAAILGAPLSTTLAWDDYGHLGEIRDIAAGLLAGLAEHPTAGINILLHGPAGTGKTELSKVLAHRTGMQIWSIGEDDEDGGEPDRGDRLAALKLALNLLARREKALILFDESDDVLENTGLFMGERIAERNGSKVHINRLLERNPVPIIWTCNDITRLDSTIIRRMSLCIEAPIPNPKIRTRILARTAAGVGLGFDDATVSALATRYEAAPALFGTAARVARLAGGGVHEFEQAIESSLRALGNAPQPCPAEAPSFDTALVKCSDNIDELVAKLIRAGAPTNWSMCIDGPPGTGKSLLARHIAALLGLEVIQKRASDLLSMYVGGSEKQIARAFTEARDRRAILIFDEADSLLHDRRTAVRSWEVSQVNEMLTWMESHPLPFVCTTNLKERLDYASLRRFTLKLRFEPLDGTQALTAFRRFFAAEPPDGLPDGLTPGDFACVRRKQAVYGEVEPQTLVEWLNSELAGRGEKPGAIGFCPPA